MISGNPSENLNSICSRSKPADQAELTDFSGLIHPGLSEDTKPQRANFFQIHGMELSNNAVAETGVICLDALNATCVVLNL